MTKKYNIIPLNGFMYAVDKKADLKEGQYWIHPKGVIFPYTNTYYKAFTALKSAGESSVIIFSNDPSLRLPLLPAVEEDIEQLACKALEFNYELYKSRFTDTTKPYNFFEVETWIKGYKAASSKYAEEDLRTVYFDGLINGRLHGVPDNKEAEEQFQEKLKLLKPTPVAVEVEMRVDRWSINDSDISESNPMLITYEKDGNNYVKVKQWYYE